MKDLTVINYNWNDNNIILKEFKNKVFLKSFYMLYIFFIY